VSGPIVLGYDGSEGARAALREAMALGRALDLPVRLAFGFEPPAFYAGQPGDQREKIESIGEETLAEGLDRAKEIDSSVSVNAETVAGRPAAALVAMAERDQARMIVVGHHGAGPIRGAIMGSVTFKVLHDAPCPVLVVCADNAPAT
jgi:nucleotide-binding universal stress UspA family protein